MKLPVSNTNAPVWRAITVKSELPSDLKPLEELSKNFWWVWNSDGKSLFCDLDHGLWRASGEYTLMRLCNLSTDLLEGIATVK